VSLFRRDKRQLEAIERIEITLKALNLISRLIYEELQRLNAVAGQWNVMEIRPGGDVSEATVRTLSGDQMHELEQIRVGETDVAMSRWAKVS